MAGERPAGGGGHAFERCRHRVQTLLRLRFLEGSGCRVEGAGFGMKGVRLRIQGVSFWVERLALRVGACGSGIRDWDLKFRVQGSRFKV